MLSEVARSRLARDVTDRLRPAYRRIRPWTGLNGLDRKVVSYLPESPGFFIEAGANDGLKQSNTYFLEARRGWRGLLVEPIPELADRCRRNRKRSTVISAALVPPELDQTNVELMDVDLMSLIPGARGSTTEDEAHLAAGEQVQGVRRRKITVRGRTLSGILDDIHAPQVELLSLDLEGFEASALRGLDLSRHRPTWILVETRSVTDIDAVLADHYDQVGCLSQHDWLFRSKGTRD